MRASSPFRLVGELCGPLDRRVGSDPIPRQGALHLDNVRMDLALVGLSARIHLHVAQNTGQLFTCGEHGLVSPPLNSPVTAPRSDIDALIRKVAVAITNVNNNDINNRRALLFQVLSMNAQGNLLEKCVRNSYRETFSMVELT